jgi:hypothetical protein
MVKPQIHLKINKNKMLRVRHALRREHIRETITKYSIRSIVIISISNIATPNFYLFSNSLNGISNLNLNSQNWNTTSTSTYPYIIPIKIKPIKKFDKAIRKKSYSSENTQNIILRKHILSENDYSTITSFIIIRNIWIGRSQNCIFICFQTAFNLISNYE